MQHVRVDCDHRRRRNPVRFIVIHHSNTADTQTTRDVLRRRGLSVHYEVERDGQAFEYFDPGETVTYHAGIFNNVSVGIEMTHLHKAPWPAEQVESGHKLILDLLYKFGLPLKVAPEDVRFRTVQEALRSGYTVFRHSNLKNTLCPDGFPMEIGGEA